MAIDNGGPAFAHSGNHVMSHPQDGMSLRDWFAGQAMRGLLSNSNFAEVEVVHTAAYAVADRMIRERSRG
jgi:hypothetical protein